MNDQTRVFLLSDRHLTLILFICIKSQFYWYALSIPEFVVPVAFPILVLVSEQPYERGRFYRNSWCNSHLTVFTIFMTSGYFS